MQPQLGIQTPVCSPGWESKHLCVAPEGDPSACTQPRLGIPTPVCTPNWGSKRLGILKHPCVAPAGDPNALAYPNTCVGSPVSAAVVPKGHRTSCQNHGQYMALRLGNCRLVVVLPPALLSQQTWSFMVLTSDILACNAAPGAFFCRKPLSEG